MKTIPDKSGEGVRLWGCDRVDNDHNCRQRYGHFHELTIEQNRVIWEAREKGWDVFYPAWDAMVPAHEYTYKGAVEFLKGAK